MKYNNLTTDELITKIVTEIGIQLPIYDYNNYRKYISEVPQNISIGDCITGIECPDIHETFRDACIRIIEWDDERKKSL